MNRIYLRRILSVIFLLMLGVIAVYLNTTRPRILIMHSYTPDYAWTRDVDVGIKRITDDWSDYTVSSHYMDTKKHQDKHWQEQAGRIARRTVDNAEPDVLIIVDDLAQKLVGSHYVNHPDMDRS